MLFENGLTHSTFSCSALPPPPSPPRSLVMSAFKIACLSYSPSPLTYRQQVFGRKDLIELRGGMLDRCWQELGSLLPWNKIEVLEVSVH